MMRAARDSEARTESRDNGKLDDYGLSMERSETFWSAPIASAGGVDITGFEALLILAALVFAALLLRRADVDGTTSRKSEDALRAEADRAAEARAMAETVSRLADAQTAIQERLGVMLAASTTQQGELKRTMDERLDAVSKRLADGLSEQQKRTGDSLGKLNERLALIDRAQKNIESLSNEVSGLQALLSNKQRRGAFGEIQMEDLVRNFMPPSAFELQATLSSGARADCLIKLPSPPGSVVVDSKFPLENWRAYSEAEDAPARETAARAFRADVLRHVATIAGKYLIPGETAETALMFLPSEAVYATLHADFPEIVDKSFRQRVMIVSPTTFMATLHTMRAVMRDARLREQAHVIQREVALLGDDVARLDDRVGKLQRHFGQAEEDVRQIRISTDKVTKRADRINEVHVADETPDENTLSPADAKRIAAE